jgi:hypothetical protein
MKTLIIANNIGMEKVSGTFSYSGKLAIRANAVEAEGADSFAPPAPG